MTSRQNLLQRAALVALVGTAVIGGAGWLGERWRFGPTADAAFDRVADSVARDFAVMATSLETTASGLAAIPDLTVGLSRSRLFEVTRASLAGDDPDMSVTVYGGDGMARAWAGRPSEMVIDRVLGDRTFFVAPGPLGLRLVYVEPLSTLEAGRRRSDGAIVAERVLSPALGVTETPSVGYQWTTSLVDVVLRPLYEGAGTRQAPYTFSLHSPSGALLLDAEVQREDLVRARETWRRGVLASVLVFLAFAAVVFSASLIVRPKRGARPAQIATITGIAALACVVAFALLRSAIGLNRSDIAAFDAALYQSPGAPELLRVPMDLLLLGLFAVGLVLVGAFLVDQGRLGSAVARRRVMVGVTTGFLLAQLTAAVAVAGALFGLTLASGDTFDGASVNLLHTSLQPWDAGRVAVLCGLILLSGAILWGCAIVLVATRLPWRTSPHDLVSTFVVAVVWMAPGSLLAVAGGVPRFPYLVLLGGAVAMALTIPRVRPRFRHASHASRMLVLFLVLLAPALLSYPLLVNQGERTKQRFVERQYATQAAGHPDELQNLLQRSLVQIDGIADLERIARSDDGNLVTDPAFLVWRQTELARRRLASAVELYGKDGRLISRFALNFPEYAGAPLDLKVTQCDWDVFGEIAPFGSDERRVLHAERAICPSVGATGAGAVVGSLVVHVAVDYRTLPFISSASPYTELVNPSPAPRQLGRAGQDVELAIYGWGLQPAFSSGTDAWSIDEGLFERLYASRESFWTTLSKGGNVYRTYVSNNRYGIYVLGYPVFGTFDHLVRLAELSTLVGLLFVLMAVATGLGTWLVPDRYRFGRALLREVRTSFYRRLFLAFIAATLVPVLALAFVIRNYFTTQLRADVEAGAARTAAVAQRVIEEAFVPQQASQGPSVLINDDLLVWISQVLDQEINIFRGAQLVATSERDLFASGLLPTRTPGAVYSAVVLERLPSYVMEDALGSLEYLVAATPIRAAGPDAILTVPLASRQQEIERQIEDLDRGILLGVTLFILLGAGSGLYMAERIADPVKRLTRATGKIARGDFDAQVVSRSADELQRLVTSFNRMAVDLQRQQVQLEKTHRLEAWADMARQVAHEIKNPLTPVQLSAEHLLRVHADRGEPLGPVVRSCVDSILTQVRLLRQISSEFSSFASSPTVERKPTALHDLVTEVMEPYLVGLENRVELTVDVPETIPLLQLDRTLVGRALTNVVENALHAMPGHGTLEVRGHVQSERVELTIADTGVGLDRETLQRIFEPYFSTKVSGTGLGMAIAKRNVELSGGTIHVVSHKGEGTVVTLAFGVAGDPSSAAGEAQPPGVG